MKIGVLASGSGTILEAILENGIEVSVVVVDRTCRATWVAGQRGVPVEVIERDSFGADFDRLGYTRKVVEVLTARGVDLVVMAGYGTVLDQPIHDAYPDRIMNTHPALLPAFPGWHAVSDALDAGAEMTGCTVHLATLKVDAGPILAQAEVPVLPGDTPESLHERIKEVERRLYPETIRRYADSLTGEPAASGPEMKSREIFEGGSVH